MAGRVGCLVPGCRRTIGDNNGNQEWICQKHWPAVASQFKKAHYSAQRVLRRKYGGRLAFWEYPAGSPARRAALDLATKLDETWAAAKDDALQKAFGLR